LIFDIRYLRDPEPLAVAHPKETSIHLRYICNAIAAGNAWTVTTPMVVMEKNAEVVGELAGLWCPLFGYEFPLTRHQLLGLNHKIRRETLRNLVMEMRMHLLLCIFRGTFPLLAGEAKDFRHERPVIPRLKRLCYFMTSPRWVRSCLQRAGTPFDPRCQQLSIG
jgi:hypothetical protein